MWTFKRAKVASMFSKFDQNLMRPRQKTKLIYASKRQKQKNAIFNFNLKLVCRLKFPEFSSFWTSIVKYLCTMRLQYHSLQELKQFYVNWVYFWSLWLLVPSGWHNRTKHFVVLWRQHLKRLVLEFILKKVKATKSFAEHQKLKSRFRDKTTIDATKHRRWNSYKVILLGCGQTTTEMTSWCFCHVLRK